MVIIICGTVTKAPLSHRCIVTGSIVNIQNIAKCSFRPHPIIECPIVIKFIEACLVFMILHGLAPLLLSAFIKQKATDDGHTRSVVREDCRIPMRRTASGQSAFSQRAAHT